MAIVTVTATRAFPYLGREVAPGDVVSMPAVVAAVHWRRGNVSLTKSPSYATRAMAPEPATVDVDSKPRRGRRYRRRDMAAESA